MATSIQSL
ncbi:Protein of unknown function [Pyronema omphalodes CBS 100304]|uniref:Uncharacterized protein n=1 Tax=Pyronema omphalodes (strain CBS 100304) TaxID=1076935 RepID=U4KV77_PYROM|nr:Protein of unknown function [Pyronema omphalodes CBS 100304]